MPGDAIAQAADKMPAGSGVRLSQAVQDAIRVGRIALHQGKVGAGQAVPLAWSSTGHWPRGFW